jgi:hypothetical protein
MEERGNKKAQATVGRIVIPSNLSDETYHVALSNPKFRIPQVP